MEYKNFRTYLQTKINESRKLNQVELSFILQELLNKYNQFNPKINQEIEILDGWKGVDSIEIFKGFDNDFKIVQHLKDKQTGFVKKIYKDISKEDVNRMLNIIKKFKLNEPVKCYEIARKLGYATWKDLWAERKQYFQYYYFPIKVLEAMNIIEYAGRGTITRLK